MKNYLLFVIILVFFLGKAQTESLDKLPVDIQNLSGFTAREVSYMAIFPGCERVDVNDKKELQSCLSKRLNELLGQKLEKFADHMDRTGITTAVAKLQFVIDKEGKIVQVKAMSGGNKELGIESEKAMNQIAGNIKKIRPATLEDGTPVNLVFQLPVKYALQVSRLGDMKWSEVVIATLKNETVKFEIRENKNESVIKVYEIKDNSSYFLGNFKTFNEILTLEPYRSIYQTSGSRLLLAEMKIDKILYRIYYGQPEKYVDVFQVNNEKEELVESLPLTDLQYSLVYLKIVLR